MQLVDVLVSLFRPNKIWPKKPRWNVDTIRHRDALIALDLRSVGRTYREIAVAIYGQSAVATGWNDPSSAMKNRVIRSVKRGYRLMNGGYKSLLE